MLQLILIAIVRSSLVQVGLSKSYRFPEEQWTLVLLRRAHTSKLTSMGGKWAPLTMSFAPSRGRTWSIALLFFGLDVFFPKGP